MAEKIKIKRKTSRRGDDNHHIISVRMPNELLKQLDNLATETNRSRNELINLLLTSAIQNVIVEL